MIKTIVAPKMAILGLTKPASLQLSFPLAGLQVCASFR